MKTEIDNEMEARDMSETPLEPPEETPHAPAGTVQRRSQWGEVWRRLKKTGQHSPAWR